MAYTSIDIRQLINSQLQQWLNPEIKEIEYIPHLYGAFNTMGLIYLVNKSFKVFVIITAHDTNQKLVLQYPIIPAPLTGELNKAFIAAVNYANVRLENSGRFQEDK